MRLSDIAKAKGLDTKAVAEAFGIDVTKNGWALASVDDDVAQAYIDSGTIPAKVEQPVAEPMPAAKSGRFWCVVRAYRDPAGPGETRQAVKFDDWVFTTSDPDTLKYIRKPDVLAQYPQKFEVLRGAYADPGEIAEFINRLMKRMYPSQTEADGVSREGRDSVLALLPPDMLEKVPKEVSNAPRALARYVASRVRVQVPAAEFGTES